MTSENSSAFDLLVFGHVTRDILHTETLHVNRLGGVVYAASVAAKLGAKVGLLASVDDETPQTVITELEARGIDCCGVKSKIGQPVVYEIYDADEAVRQTTFRSGPSGAAMSLPEEIPASYHDAKFALVYPVHIPSALKVARILKGAGCCIAVDIQHDIASLEEGQELLEMAEVVFGNLSAILHLTGTSSVDEAIKILAKNTTATLIVKMGMCGSLVQSGQNRYEIPCFQSDFQLTVGAGDAFDAAFLVNLSHLPVQESARTASLITASVIESTGRDPAEALVVPVDSSSTRHEVFLSPAITSGTCIYIAGHFHSQPMKRYIELVASAIENLGFKTFVPHRDVGVVGVGGVNSESAYSQDIKGLHASKMIVAVLDNASRGGTFVEIGIAVERGMPVFGICTDKTLGISNMVKSSCREIHSSLKPLLNPLVSYFSQ